MADAREEVIWSNQAGVVLSNAGNIFLEAGGQARVSWVKAGTWGAGTHVTGGASITQTNSVDTIRGWPNFRREHILTIDTKGCDRMFVEWRGQVTAASGFALGGVGIPATFARSYFFSTERAWACGTFGYDSAIGYMREPHTVNYNINQENNNASPMSGHDDVTTAQPAQIASGFALRIRGRGHAGDLGNDMRQVFQWETFPKIPFDLNWQGGTTLGQGGLLWGYTQRDSSVDNSRYPQVGDKMGYWVEVGYEDGATFGSTALYNLAVGGNALSLPVVGPLRTTGLKKVYLCLFAGAPVTGATPLWLDFTNASMTVIGKISVYRVYMYRSF